MPKGEASAWLTPVVRYASAMAKRVDRELVELFRLNPTMLPAHLAKVFGYRICDVERVWAAMHQPREKKLRNVGPRS